MKKLSIITINFNNHAGLEKTLSSIFNQTNKDFEYIVIDGDSSDKSKDLILKNKDKFSYWVSEPDHGIYHAMNKGIQQATGEYLLFINSGDTLFDNQVIEKSIEHLKDYGIIYGNIQKNEFHCDSSSLTPDLDFFLNDSLPHQATFIQRNLFNTMQYNESYKIVSDWEFFFVQIVLNKVSFKHINQTISLFDTTGISSQPENLHILTAERNSTYNKYLPGLTKFLQENKKLKARLDRLLHRRLNRLIKYIRNYLKTVLNIKKPF